MWIISLINFICTEKRNPHVCDRARYKFTYSWKCICWTKYAFNARARSPNQNWKKKKLRLHRTMTPQFNVWKKTYTINSTPPPRVVAPLQQKKDSTSNWNVYNKQQRQGNFNMKWWNVQKLYASSITRSRMRVLRRQSQIFKQSACMRNDKHAYLTTTTRQRTYKIASIHIARFWDLNVFYVYLKICFMVCLYKINAYNLNKWKNMRCNLWTDWWLFF